MKLLNSALVVLLSAIPFLALPAYAGGGGNYSNRLEQALLFGQIINASKNQQQVLQQQQQQQQQQQYFQTTYPKSKPPVLPP